MLLYIRLSEALKARVDQLVARGLYSDLTSAVTVALENLLLAEEENCQDQRPKRASLEQNPQDVPRTSGPKTIPARNQAHVVTRVAPEVQQRPAILNWTEPPSIPEQLIAPVPADLFRAGQLVPVERWIFGQQNRA